MAAMPAVGPRASGDLRGRMSARRATTRYAKTVIDTDEWLRKVCTNGSRRHVTWKDVAEALNVTIGAATSALAYLATVPNSGLTRINKQHGTYEFRTPKEYPPALVELRDSLQQIDPTVRPVRRTNLMTEFLAWYDEQPPGKVFTTRTVADALDAHISSVGNCVRRLAKHGGCEHLEGNLFRKGGSPTVVIDSLTDLQEAVKDGVLEEARQEPTSEFVEPEDEAEPQPQPQTISPQRQIPSPLVVAAAINRRLGLPTEIGPYKFLDVNRKNEPILQAPDGKIGIFHEL